MGPAPAGVVRWGDGLELEHPVASRPLRALAKRMSYGAVRIAHGPERGCLFDPDGTNPGYGLGITEEVQELFADQIRRGDVAYDVGAYVAFFSALAGSLVGPQGTVIAFERAPPSAATRRNLEPKGYTVRPLEDEADGDLPWNLHVLATPGDCDRG